MSMKKNIKLILKSKSGSSIVYVLAVMLMLIIIGTSVLTAAVANVGFSGRQRDHTRGVMLGDAIHRNIMYVLQKDPDGESSDLSTQIPEGVLASKIVNGQDFPNFSLDVGIPDIASFYGGKVQPEGIQIELANQRVDYQEGFPDFENPGEEEEEISGFADVFFQMDVTVTVQVGSAPMSTTVRYEYYGQYENLTLPTGSGDTLAADLIQGEWRLVSYEKSQN